MNLKRDVLIELKYLFQNGNNNINRPTKFFLVYHTKTYLKRY